MTFEEYKEYTNSTYNKDGLHKVRHFANDGEMTNANNTSDRDADKNVSWINYWRAMTGNHTDPLYCSSCGKEIYSGKIPDSAMLKYRLSGDKSSHKAMGGHIWVQGTQNVPGGRYITPLCPECNAKRGQRIPVKKGSIIFKELGAKVVEKN